jgi:hypothetical protein
MRFPTVRLSLAGASEIKFSRFGPICRVVDWRKWLLALALALALSCSAGPAIAAGAPEGDVLAHALHAEFALQAGELPQTASVSI